MPVAEYGQPNHIINIPRGHVNTIKFTSQLLHRQLSRFFFLYYETYPSPMHHQDVSLSCSRNIKGPWIHKKCEKCTKYRWCSTQFLQVHQVWKPSLSLSWLHATQLENSDSACCSVCKLERSNTTFSLCIYLFVFIYIIYRTKNYLI